MIRYLLVASLLIAALVLYAMGQQGYAALLIGGLVLEMSAVAVATWSGKRALKE